MFYWKLLDCLKILFVEYVVHFFYVNKSKITYPGSDTKLFDYPVISGDVGDEEDFFQEKEEQIQDPISTTPGQGEDNSDLLRWMVISFRFIGIDYHEIYVDSYLPPASLAKYLTTDLFKPKTNICSLKSCCSSTTVFPYSATLTLFYRFFMYCIDKFKFSRE